jgi:hypothetical protein
MFAVGGVPDHCGDRGFREQSPIIELRQGRSSKHFWGPGVWDPVIAALASAVGPRFSAAASWGG